MSQKPDQQTLFETASAQQGYFTASQAAKHGLGTDDVSYHVGRGRYVRVLPGVYRLRDYPDSPRGEVMAAWLAVGRDKSVVSRESALDLLGLSDVIPAAIHITVPRTRRNLPRLPGVQIHTTTRPLNRRDTAVREGITLTGPQRTILDSAEAGTGPEQIEMAVRQAVRRGLVDPDELLDNAKERGGRVYRLIQSGLTGTER